ncbi:hypothetical protein SAMN05421770_101478 [Granulicella rosea]|uniref:Uncharacterized protein n=1 Tax=Granulicella rosea TaxID=474952 RepID=A0A239DJ86_9BACT|nr:hypothetical protein [Granulicella rosea]SNS31928.1 hypothetical protein SAMN05421770_101478 [Granulicella rosea]
MKQFTAMTLSVFSFFCLLLALEPRAYGYVDPGSGFVAIQTLASVAAACGFFFRSRIARLFGKDKQEQEPIPATAEKGNTRTAA